VPWPCCPASRIRDVTEGPEPDRSDGSVLVETLAIGVYGTDREILAGEYGEAPPGGERLVLGHESIGCVLKAPGGVGMEPGDLSWASSGAPTRCRSNYAVGEWEMCRNGQYTEHGIKALHGFAHQRCRADPEERSAAARNGNGAADQYQLDV
jgi:threonine dehydrogenase-like Zn-dependent dehydrogenase